LLNRWLRLKREYEAEVAQYLSVWSEGEQPQRPRKALTPEALQRLGELGEAVERAHEEWMAAARGEDRKSAQDS
jgi:hypothetical protein